MYKANSNSVTTGHALLDVLRDIRETVSESSYEGRSCNLYLWIYDILVPFEDIEASPDCHIEFHAQTTWQWAPEPMIGSPSTFAVVTDDAMYTRVGVAVIVGLRAYPVVAECPNDGMDPADLRFTKEVKIDAKGQKCMAFFDPDRADVV